jgi:anthranilate synthase/aminodeoxychorismate synthase-like glutamine amidotransferase
MQTLKILLIDNYDSFTYNLVHYLEGAGADVTVWRNDEINFSALETFDQFVISPGPGLPKDAGDLMTFIGTIITQKPVLGVCLGFQAIVEHFGGKIYNQPIVKHGVAEKCRLIVSSPLFENIPSEFNVGLYHSWAANEENLPGELCVTALSENDIVMAFEHTSLAVYGVQFHPESVLTEHGHTVIRNFLALAGK